MAKRKNDGYGISKGFNGKSIEDLPISLQRKLQSKAVTIERKQKRQEKRNFDTE